MIRDPVDLGYTRSTISKWRSRLFAELPYCSVCWHLYGRQRLAAHLHEGIVTRGDCQGIPFPDRLRCFADVNSYPICAECHVSPPPREWFFRLACDKYGESDVRDWYSSFWWKVPPRREFMP